MTKQKEKKTNHFLFFPRFFFPCFRPLVFSFEPATGMSICDPARRAKQSSVRSLLSIKRAEKERKKERKKKGKQTRIKSKGAERVVTKGGFLPQTAKETIRRRNKRVQKKGRKRQTRRV